jgi:hypothetical protein
MWRGSLSVCSSQSPSKFFLIFFLFSEKFEKTNSFIHLTSPIKAFPKTKSMSTTPSTSTNTQEEKKTEEKKTEEKKEGEIGGLSLDEVTGTLKLTSKDKKEYEIERKNTFISVLIKTSLDTDPTATEVPVLVTSSILAEVVNYMNHHKGVEAPIIEKPLRSKVFFFFLNRPQ